MAHPVGLHGITQNQRDAGETAHETAPYESIACGADCPQMVAS